MEPDFPVWKEYAYRANIHAAIMTYLEIKKSNFYKVETSVDGKTFVTARGWDDLSQMIALYEKHQLKVDQKLIMQYLQNPKIAKDFAVYYDLYMKYRSDYQVKDILAGKASETIKKRAKQAKFDERLSLIGLLLEGVGSEMRNIMDMEALIKAEMEALKKVKAGLARPKATAEALLETQIKENQKKYEKGKISNSLSAEQKKLLLKLVAQLEEQKLLVAGEEDGVNAFKMLKTEFDKQVKELIKNVKETGKQLENMFLFCEEVFEEGQEMLIIVTELTANCHSAKYISRYGCDAYFRHNKELLFYERQKELEREIQQLKLE